jgi:hypothetical protein
LRPTPPRSRRWSRRSRARPTCDAAQGGLEGDYGFFDAIDYTNRGDQHDTTMIVSRHPAGVVVRSFMAHHQGMTLVALANAVLGDPMVSRFHADPRVQATELLLQERVPRYTATVDPRPSDEVRATAPPPPVPVRRYRTAQTAFPHAQFLSNGNFVSVITNSGGGGSFARGLSVTRTRRDATCDPGGSFIYFRDVRSGRCGRRRRSQSAVTPRTTASNSGRRRPRSIATTATSPRGPRSRCPPRTTSRCGA